MHKWVGLLTKTSPLQTRATMELRLTFLLLLLPLICLACRGLDCGAGFCMEKEDGTYECVCQGGYAGENCDKPVARRSTVVSPCLESPCQNGGTCIELPIYGEGDELGESIGEADTIGGSGRGGLDCETGENCYACLCLPGFTGPACETADSCPTIETAGVVWQRTASSEVFITPCHEVDNSLHGANVVRECSLDGVWEEPDYTRCTIESKSPPFILLWVVAEESNGEELEEILAQINTLVVEMLKVKSYLTETVSQTQMLLLYESDAAPRVFFTYKIEFSRDASIADVSSSFNSTLAPSVIINETTVLLESQGYMGFFPSDVCGCIKTAAALRTLCTTVNDNDQTNACDCFSPSDGCECQGPFYVGSGLECAVDSDGDGYPNTPLPSCTETSAQPYCSVDKCPVTYYLENTAFPCETQDISGFEGCLGGRDMWGFVWPNAQDEEAVEVACPNGQGSATRACVNSEWEMAQVLECGSSGFINALTEAESVFENDDMDLAARLDTTATIMQEVLELIQPREGLSHLPGDLNSTNAILSGVLSLLEGTLHPRNNITRIPQQNVFGVFNTALHPNNAQGWMTLHNATGGAAKLLDSMERYGLYRSLVAGDRESRDVSQDTNFVLGVIRHSASNSSSVTFPKSLDDLENTAYSTAIPAQITIPSDLLRERITKGENTAPVAGSIARGMETVLLPTSLGETWSVASQVISAQVAERSVRSSTPITATFTFDSVVNASEFRCAYWNFSDVLESKGSWAFDGVEMVGITSSSDGTTVVTCQSLHLTSFAVLVNAAGGVSDLSSAELQALMVVSYIGCAISLACLLFAIIYYITLWKDLLSQVHYFIHLNLAIALFLAYLVFVLGIELARQNKGVCIFVAALLQYLFLSAFCWMMCEGVMLYLMLVVVFSKLSKKWWFFLLLGWVPPLVPVVIGLAVRHNEYGVEDDRELEYCWLSTNKGVIWAFIAPMLIIIIINTVFLVVALVKVLQTRRRQAYNMKSTASKHLNLFKVLFRATVVLLPILGLTWVFGLFAVNQNSSWLAWLFTIFNTLQGCFIFIVHVILSDKFWKNSRIKKLRRYVSTSVKSSQFGSTVYSTIRRSSTRQDGSGNTIKLSKYTSSGSEMVPVPDASVDVITNVGTTEKELEAEGTGTAKSVEKEDLHNS